MIFGVFLSAISLVLVAASTVAQPPLECELSPELKKINDYLTSSVDSDDLAENQKAIEKLLQQDELSSNLSKVADEVILLNKYEHKIEEWCLEGKYHLRRLHKSLGGEGGKKCRSKSLTRLDRILYTFGASHSRSCIEWRAKQFQGKSRYIDQDALAGAQRLSELVLSEDTNIPTSVYDSEKKEIVQIGFSQLIKGEKEVEIKNLPKILLDSLRNLASENKFLFRLENNATGKSNANELKVGKIYANYVTLPCYNLIQTTPESASGLTEDLEFLDVAGHEWLKAHEYQQIFKTWEMYRLCRVIAWGSPKPREWDIISTIDSE